jgi:hypothetical protein
MKTGSWEFLISHSRWTCWVAPLCAAILCSCAQSTAVGPSATSSTGSGIPLTSAANAPQVGVPAATSPIISQASDPRYPDNVAELNNYLKRKDYYKIGIAALSARDPRVLLHNMNWERDNVLAGAAIYLSILYASDLWRGSNSNLDGKASHEWKKTALMVMFYAYDITYVDGVKCADKSAPAHRRE